ncbi:hypothetical protein [Nocardia pseudobrasiliensis]|uniref:Uncharacterized protein n=1 Tax=Nocardia pseudobrasiliensis TaxID=45979 RepID=A0A370I4Q1_9NOCA|nr:hypothetical protein [Nocardia pseudobrasiliensis]RDI64324.1 hypothetical protein DFR76_108156 [Nocardia pseudobrasiliensis]
MSYPELDRRVTKLEGRVTDIEEVHCASILHLRRDVTALQLGQERLFSGLNTLGHGIALMMERLDLHPITLPVATPPTEAEIDAALEEDYS